MREGRREGGRERERERKKNKTWPYHPTPRDSDWGYKQQDVL